MLNKNCTEARKKISNPKRRGWDKAIAALDWVRRWGYSSPMIIDQINGEQRRGLAKRLVEAGYLKSMISASGGYFNDVPHKILTLTPHGFEVLAHAQNLTYGYDFSKGINQATLRHHHVCQKVTLDYLLNADNLKFFQSEIDRQGKSILSIKQPDVVLVFDETEPQLRQSGIECLRKLAVEVELTGKYNMKFDQFLHSTLLSLGSSGSIDEIEIYFDSLHQLDRYKRALTPGNEVNIWDKNDRGYWMVDEVQVVPEYVRHKIKFKMLN